MNRILNFLMPWVKTEDTELKKELTNKIDSFAAPDNNDGAIEIERNVDISAPKTAMHQMMYGSDVPRIQNTKDLINQYRSLARYHEVDNAIDEIINDAIVQDDTVETVYLNLDKTEFSENIKNKINDEFNIVLRLLNFEREGRRLFRKWFIDSRIYFHKMIDPNRPKDGIKELRLLDSRNIELFREVLKTQENGSDVYKGVRDYFKYNPMNDTRYAIGNVGSDVCIPVNAMVYAHSGKTDVDGKTIIGYLHNAIKPANQLKMLEDAMVIYRITRAPERRVFYIDVGNMPPRKATEHLNNVMQGLKNRVVYDSSTGKVKNSANNLSMTEDYWLMRRDGKATTEVSTLPGAQSMGEMDDVRWFNKKLYESLKIPLSRIPQEGNGVMFGAGSEITRDELQFSKYIRGLQQQFESILIDPLKTNLILKGIMTESEWNEQAEFIRVVFSKDSYYEEIKDIEILERRVGVVQTLASADITGKYLSHDYIMKNILKMSEDDIKIEREKIDEENKDGVLNKPDELEDF